MEKTLQYLGIAWSIIAFVAALSFFFGGEWNDYQKIKEIVINSPQESNELRIELIKKAESVENKLDMPIQFNCPKGQVLTGVKSKHTNGAEDRQFIYQCSEIVLRKI